MSTWRLTIQGSGPCYTNSILDIDHQAAEFVNRLGATNHLTVAQFETPSSGTNLLPHHDAPQVSLPTQGGIVPREKPAAEDAVPPKAQPRARSRK